jgi:creatinine amidohydrolase/Fe(II)-dependent formamide hydrolase-like protein
MRLRGSTDTALLCLFAALTLQEPTCAQVRQLSELSVTDIQALDRNQTVVIMAGGLMEEHGPYLPAFTDGYTNEWIAARVAETIVATTGRPVVMFPLIPLGVGTPEDFGGRALFSGSYTVRLSTMRAVYMDLATALGDDGFRWIFVVNRHGSPSHSRALLEASEYFRDVFDGRMVVLSSYRYNAVADREPVLTPDEARENAGDVHAGADETSRMLFLKPELVHSEHRAAPPHSAATIADLPHVAAAPSWPGYFGSPRLATASIGAEILRRIAEDSADLALKVLDGLDPRTLPNAGTAEGAFKVLDDNLLRRSEVIEQQQRDWLSKQGLR